MIIHRLPTTSMFRDCSDVASLVHMFHGLVQDEIHDNVEQDIQNNGEYAGVFIRDFIIS